MLTEAERAENLRLCQLATANAKQLLKPGDRVRVTRCPGTKRWFTFARWNGPWMVSKSGIDDFHPRYVDMVNQTKVDFTRRVSCSHLNMSRLLSAHLNWRTNSSRWWRTTR